MLPPCMFQMSSNLPEDTALLQRRQLAWRRSTVGWRQKQQLCEELRAGLNGPWVKGSHILKLRIWTPCQVLPLRFHALTFVLLGGVTTFTASTENIQTGLPPLLLGGVSHRLGFTQHWTGLGWAFLLLTWLLVFRSACWEWRHKQPDFGSWTLTRTENRCIDGKEEPAGSSSLSLKITWRPAKDNTDQQPVHTRTHTHTVLRLVIRVGRWRAWTSSGSATLPTPRHVTSAKAMWFWKRNKWKW